MEDWKLALWKAGVAALRSFVDFTHDVSIRSLDRIEELLDDAE
jgi:hypothetical protein